MKKVMLKAYCKNNLGDDLFLKIISDRYKNEFYSICSPKYKYINRFNNISFNKSYIKYYTYRILEKIFKKNKLMERKYFKKSNYVVTIGGSIFIENDKNSVNEIVKRFDTQGKNHYILGANFGPYKSEKYKQIIEKFVFESAEDVCFRDSFSYNLFNNNKKIRQAPDIIFSLDISKVNIIKSKKIIISVIDCCNRFSNKTTENYEHTILEIINRFTKLNYEVILMSFCKAEGDEKAINRIINKITDKKIKKLTSKYYYRGNIEEALNVIGDSEIVFGSRFHANILGLIMNKTVIPIAYSDKTINVMRDINFQGKIIDIRNISNFSINDISEKDFNYKCDVSAQKKEAVKHFEKLDMVLKGKYHE